MDFSKPTIFLEKRSSNLKTGESSGSMFTTLKGGGIRHSIPQFATFITKTSTSKLENAFKLNKV